MLEGMRNPANGKVYERAGAMPAQAFAKLAECDDLRKIERVQYGFMAWISDQPTHYQTVHTAWMHFDRERS